MFELDHVSIHYGATHPVERVSAVLGPAPVAVMGPSGSGKSSLLRVLAGQQRPTSGSVSLCGSPVASASWLATGDPRVALVHQDYRLVEFLSVAENLLLAAEIRKIPKGLLEARQVMERVGLDYVDPDRMPHTLSGGEQQRVAIARALMCDSRALLADEPTGALDAETTEKVIDLLVEVADREGIVLVVATHDESVAAKMQERFRLDLGRLRSAA